VFAELKEKEAPFKSYVPKGC